MNELACAAVLGAVSGSRSMLGLAVVADRVLPPAAAGLMKLLALGELAADKSPTIPARTEPIPLAGRIVAGALAAAAVASRGRRLQSAAVGAAGALSAAFALYQLRQWATTGLGVSNIAAGLAEDALALSAGCLARPSRSVAERA